MTGEKADLLTYNTRKEKFDSVYERNKFYRGLFGYTQKVKKDGKTYEYEKEGLFDEIPNTRIDDSVFILAKKHTPTILDYFKEWEDKVSHHVFTVLIQDKKILQKIKGEVREDKK